MHKAAFAACGIDGRYEAIQVQPSELGAWTESARRPNVLGFNVTLPHKQAITQYLDELEGDARLTGAVNTVTVVRSAAPGARPHPLPLLEGEGVPGSRLVGTNTDTIGFRRALNEEAGMSLQGEHVVLLGAGGAARAIALVALQDGAASLCIANRHIERAEQLIADLTPAAGKTHLRVAELNGIPVAEALSNATVVVNATSVGLRSTAMPIDPALITPGSLVVDIVYNPLKTAFLEAAERRGASILGGLGMLVYQAAAAFERWTGQPAPIPAMRAAALRVLSAER
jgi:shikimate dehydrogenase